jgi:hypothetical protein
MQIAFAHQHSQQQVIRQIILTPENDEEKEFLDELDVGRDYRIRLVKGKTFKTHDEEKREHESLFIVMARFKHPTAVTRDIEVSRSLELY